MVVADKGAYFGKAWVLPLGSTELWATTFFGIDPHAPKLIKGEGLAPFANSLLLKDRRVLVFTPYEEGNHQDRKSKDK